MFISVCFRAVLFTLLWCSISHCFVDTIFSALSIIAVVSVSYRFIGLKSQRIAWRNLIIFILFFIYHSTKGGIAVSRLALRPRLILEPMSCDITLPFDGVEKRLIVANIFSLMPGTLSIALIGDTLRLHILDRSLFSEELNHQVVAKYKNIFTNEQNHA